MADKPVIGFIGLGYMGHGMAKNILQNGYTLHVRGNRNRAPVDSLVGMGAKEAASAAAMAADCDIIHLCLSNSPQVEAVIRGPDGILAGGRQGLTVIDATTSIRCSSAVYRGMPRYALTAVAAAPPPPGGHGRACRPAVSKDPARPQSTRLSTSRLEPDPTDIEWGKPSSAH